jgi:hypothetical protein
MDRDLLCGSFSRFPAIVGFKSDLLQLGFVVVQTEIGGLFCRQLFRAAYIRSGSFATVWMSELCLLYPS